MDGNRKDLPQKDFEKNFAILVLNNIEREPTAGTIELFAYRLFQAESVAFWQGSGTGYAFGDTSKINIKTASGHNVTASGILGVMFDRDALGVCNIDRRVTTNYNPKAEFYTNWYKFDAGYFNDFNENFVVFFVA